MHKLYILPKENIIFHSKNDLNNYVKNMFINNKDISKHNYFLLGEIKEESKGLFLDRKNELYYKKFQQLINKNININNIREETFYCIFYFIFEDMLITNIISKHGDKVLLNINDEILDSITRNKGDDLINELEKLINEKELTIVNFNNCDINIKEIIEKTIQFAVNRQFPANPLISISHNKENKTLYHIHRLVS